MASYGSRTDKNKCPVQDDVLDWKYKTIPSLDSE